MKVFLTQEAQEELSEAAKWYADRSIVAASRFLDAYHYAKGLVLESPRQWPEIEPGVHRVLLRRFPYSLLYAIDEERIIVLAVMHQKRHPDSWKRTDR